jgi:hypothetical protein
MMACIHKDNSAPSFQTCQAEKRMKLRGDLVKVEAELEYAEAFINDEHIGIVVGRMAKVKIVPLDYCFAFAVKADNAPRIASYRNL